MSLNVMTMYIVPSPLIYKLLIESDTKTIVFVIDLITIVLVSHIKNISRNAHQCRNIANREKRPKQERDDILYASHT